MTNGQGTRVHCARVFYLKVPIRLITLSPLTIIALATKKRGLSTDLVNY